MIFNAQISFSILFSGDNFELKNFSQNENYILKICNSIKINQNKNYEFSLGYLKFSCHIKEGFENISK